jgi:urease accessory protein
MPDRVATIITTSTTMVIIMDNDTARQAPIWGEGAAFEEEAGAGSAGEDAAALLLIWLSPQFPVGSFAFSHGMEWAVQAGRIHDAMTVTAWLEALLEHGSLRNDAIFAACAWRAAAERDARSLAEVNDFALAMAGSRERHLETTAQGNAFMMVMRDAWRAPLIDWVADKLACDIVYPVAVGLASAAHGVALRDMLGAFVLAQVQNLVSAVVRLSVIGHTDGQRVIASLLGPIREAADATRGAMLEDAGGAAFQSDIATLAHETQYSRLFRS